MKQTRPLGIAAICAALLAVRLAAALWFPVVPAHDAADYENLGRNLSLGRGYVDSAGHPETFRPPLYPAFIAGVYTIAGRQPEAVRCAQAFLDVATCLLLWWWARQRLGAQAAMLTLVLAGISWSAIGSVRLLLSECLAAFLVTLSVVMFDLNRSGRGGWLAMAMAGIAAGLLTLARALLLLFPLMFVWRLLAERGDPRERLRAVVVLVSAYLLVLAPWCVRNWIVTGSPAPITTQLGLGLYVSQFRNPGQPYGTVTHDAVTEQTRDMSSGERSRFLTRETFRRLWEHPARLFLAYPEKLLYLWIPLDWEVIGHRTWNVTYLVTAVLALFGGWCLWRVESRLVLHALLPLAYLCLIALPFYGSPRLRLPAEPLLAPLAAFGLLRVKWRP